MDRQFFFEAAFRKLLETEGGYVDDSSDHGGKTNYGVTIATLSDYLGRPATPDEIKNIDLETVKKIYKQNYWDRLHLSEINNVNVAYAFFDQSVNRGTRRVAELIQKLVGVPIDGIIGPLTIKSINLMNPRVLVLNFVKESQNAYALIVSHDPTQAKFLNGWMARTHKLLDIA